HHALTLLNHRFLIDACVLVRALELGELIDVAAHLARQLRGMVLAFHTHDDALGVDRVDNAVAASQYNCARIPRGNTLHSGTHDWRLRAEQRYGLSLHIR